MFFGATPFATTTFAGLGSQNALVLANGNRLNISIGNVQTGTRFPAVVTGNRFNLANGTVSVISWQTIDPGASGVWTPIDPLNP